MKIRNGFVSNSSSTSFLILLKENEIPYIKTLLEKMPEDCSNSIKLWNLDGDDDIEYYSENALNKIKKALENEEAQLYRITFERNLSDLISFVLRDKNYNIILEEY